MLQFLRQLNPSILTGAGLCPNFMRTHPPPPPPAPPPLLLLREDEGESMAANEGESGLSLLFPNCSSWIKGFEALTGGDPLKNGGEEAT